MSKNNLFAFRHFLCSIFFTEAWQMSFTFFDTDQLFFHRCCWCCWCCCCRCCRCCCCCCCCQLERNARPSNVEVNNCQNPEREKNVCEKKFARSFEFSAIFVKLLLSLHFSSFFTLIILNCHFLLSFLYIISQ